MDDPTYQHVRILSLLNASGIPLEELRLKRVAKKNPMTAVEVKKRAVKVAKWGLVLFSLSWTGTREEGTGKIDEISVSEEEESGENDA